MREERIEEATLACEERDERAEGERDEAVVGERALEIAEERREEALAERAVEEEVALILPSF